MKKKNGITIRTDIRPGDIGIITYLHGVSYKDEYNHGISFESIVSAGLSEYKDVYLWTTDELDTAHHLYKKTGFKLTEEKPSNEFGKPLIEQRYDFVF